MVEPLIDMIGEVDPTCQNNDHLPVIHFEFDGIDYPLGPEDYILKTTIAGHLECVLGIIGMEVPDDYDFPYLIIGDSFIRKYYSYFDMDNMRVGFSPKNEPCWPPPCPACRGRA